jgi:light-regulated signal transduction histidine kinase (bacteriophytochrome)
MLSFALISLFGAFLILSYVLTYRRTLRAISVLRFETTIIGSGNLDHAIEVKGNDEISELAHAFNRMTASLKGVTASQSELEREVEARKRAEEEIRELNQTLSRRAAELEVANKELESFAYSVSHDLRAPLRHITGFGKMLLDDYAGDLDEHGRGYVETMCQAGLRMGQLISDLLNLSRVARAEIRREPVDLSKFAELIMLDLRNEEPERQVETVIAPGISAHGDARLMRIVLDNLLGNAWKFTAKCPGAKIEFGTERHKEGPVYFVRDNGAGFDARYVERLFSPFQRLHKNEEFPGTGIGLATVQRIVHRHGGRVWAEGAVDQGATFYFSL